MTDPRTADHADLGCQPTLAVAYDVSSSSPLEIVDSLGATCELVWVVDGTDPRLGSWSRLLPRLGRVIDIAGRDLQSVAGELSEIGVDGVVAFTDSQLPVASRLTDLLGCPGNPAEVVRALTDKATQREVLAAAGLPGPRVVAVDVCMSVAEAVRLTAHLTHPVVVKPRRGSGSEHTVRADDPVARERALHEALHRPDCTDLIVEEWLGGAAATPLGPFADYVSVEAIAQQGVIVPLALTGKFALAEPCRETGNFLPHLLDADTAGAVVELAVLAASALGVQSGVLHVEVKLTPYGPAIIEVNGRIGGGGIDALYAARRGCSLTRLAAAVAVGRPLDLPTLDLTPAPGPFAYAYFVQAPLEARRLVGLGNLEAVAALGGVEATAVNRTLGDHLDWRSGSMGYLVSVRGRAETPEELASVPGTIDELLDIAVE